MAYPPRRVNELEAERFTLLKEHAQATATTSLKVYKVPANRTLRLTRATYLNVTGLAEDNDNNFAGAVKNTTTVVADLFNTDANLDPDTGASLAADTFVEGTLSATAADHVFAGGDEVLLVLTETGAATLPAGTLILEGYLY